MNELSVEAQSCFTCGSSIRSESPVSCINHEEWRTEVITSNASLNDQTTHRVTILSSRASLTHVLLIVGLVIGAPTFLGLSECCSTSECCNGDEGGECGDGDGWTTADGDGNDNDSNVHPGATEVCNGSDDNCDGLIDESAVCSCPTGSYNSHIYYFCATVTSWDHGGEACTQAGLNLVTVNDSSEDSWLMNTAVSYVSTGYGWWMGYNDNTTEGTWVWESGESSSYTNWDGGEPNNSGDEDCGNIIDLDVNSYHWNDLPCSLELPYICE